jgi:hypothetical protein
VLKEVECFSPKYKSGDDDIRIKITSKYPVLLIQGWVTWPRETPNQASSKITTGDFVIESISMLKKIKPTIEITDEMIHDATKSIQKKYILLAFKEGLKLNFKKSFLIFKSLQLNCLKITNLLFYKTINKDIILNYSPSEPYKREFIALIADNSKII